MKYKVLVKREGIDLLEVVVEADTEDAARDIAIVFALEVGDNNLIEGK
jgi:hypothetical protein